MSQSEQMPGFDPARSKLRATVAIIEDQLAQLPRDGTKSDGLRVAVADLVQQLALGPEPALRACPSCGKHGMRAATICGFCWTKLTPPSTHA
jgi:hypothetical protein